MQDLFQIYCFFTELTHKRRLQVHRCILKAFYYLKRSIIRFKDLLIENRRVFDKN